MNSESINLMQLVIQIVNVAQVQRTGSVFLSVQHADMKTTSEMDYLPILPHTRKKRTDSKYNSLYRKTVFKCLMQTDRKT